MKRFFVMTLFLGALAGSLHAQVVDTTVCDIVKNPKSFDGKMVRIKGTVSVDFDQFVVTDSDCGYQVNGIWISYPQGTKGKAGPVAVVQVQPAHNFTGTVSPVTRTPVNLDKNKDFKQFDSLLSQTRYKKGICFACFKNKVNATLVGRLDGVSEAYLHHDPSGKIIGFGGFGNMNAYPARLVLQSVSDVSAKEIDFSASDAASKDEMAFQPGPGGPGAGQFLSDPLDNARKAAAAAPPGQVGTEIQKGVAAWGKPKEQNGVILAWGTVNEASASEDARGAKDSPDGVLFTCTIDKDRLDFYTLTLAIIHMGHHISVLRAETPENEMTPPYVLEYNAWDITLLYAIANGAKTLTMPGGFLVWNLAWPPADRESQFGTTLKSYLSSEEFLSQ